MNWFPLRLKLLVFRNKYTVIATIILLVGLVTLVKYAAFFAYNQYARATFMKPFYDKVALEEKYDQELPLSNFVSRATTHAVNTSSNGQSGWLENCSVAGTYFDYVANKQLQNVRFCSYEYISYFWVAALDDATISHASQQMQAAGWTLLDDTTAQAVNRQRIGSTMIGGYSFSRPGGLTADMMFVNKPVQLQNSGSFSAYPYWDFVTHTRDPHNFFLAVDIGYSARMQGSQLLDE